VREHPAPTQSHHLEFALAIQAYGSRVAVDAVAARADVLQAFGLAGDRQDDVLLYALLLLCTNRFKEARELLRQLGLAVPDKIGVICNVLAAVFKYFNAGLSIRELAEFGMEPMLAFHQATPRAPGLRRALLDMLLYFGAADDVEHILTQGGAEDFAAEAQELAHYRQRLAVGDRCRLSVVMLTWRRPALLRRTLEALQGALAETDVEIIVGVNDDLAETRAVVDAAGVDQVLFNPCNIGLELYKPLFDLAQGRYLIEIDDDVDQFPSGFDRQIISCLEERPDLGLVGHWPVSFLDTASGAKLPPAPSFHQRDSIAGLPFGYGPVAGVCAGFRRRDFLAVNGFSHAALTHVSGEEPQLIRKFAVQGRLSGVIFDQGLSVCQNG
jgi:hypothetical protein